MLEVFLLSMVPIIELRGAIPLGIVLLGLDWSWVFLLGVVGSFIPAVVIVLGFDKGLHLLDRLGIGWTHWVSNYYKKRSRPVERWGLIGLVVLVAIPLPFTGAWTGALVASGLRLPVIRSLGCILIGLIAAGGIVTGLVLQGG